MLFFLPGRPSSPFSWLPRKFLWPPALPRYPHRTLFFNYITADQNPSVSSDQSRWFISLSFPLDLSAFRRSSDYYLFIVWGKDDKHSEEINTQNWISAFLIAHKHSQIVTIKQGDPKKIGGKKKSCHSWVMGRNDVIVHIIKMTKRLSRSKFMTVASLPITVLAFFCSFCLLDK